MADGLPGFKFGMSQQAVRDLALMALADLLRARSEWDEPPVLLFAYFEDGAVRISDRSLVPGWMWSKGPPALVLESLANAAWHSPVQKVLAAVTLETFFGVAWRSEVWMAQALVSDTQAVASLNRAAARRRLFAHPARVECRNVWAMTRVGMLWASQERGSPEVDSRPARKKDIEGTVPDALTTLFRTVLTRNPKAVP
jgi:hypothetical protein